MKISVISIGNELLNGQICNSSLALMGQLLFPLGVTIAESATIPDQIDIIIDQIRRYFINHDVIILTGGLGPTSDDLTREAVAQCFNRNFIQDQATVQQLYDYWHRKYHEDFPINNLKQADCIEGAKMIKNNGGTAPGQVLEIDHKLIFLLPGPPHELQPMFINDVIPLLKQRLTNSQYIHQLTLFGLPESEVAQKTTQIVSDLSLAYCANPGIVQVYLSSSDERKSVDALQKLTQHFKSNILPQKTLPESIIHILRNQHLNLSTAESCTGGLIAQNITAISGASDVFWGGFITYDNEAKKQLIHVPEETLNQFGAVSVETATAMVNGLIDVTHTETGIAVTGIAGPTGGTSEKPVGTVIIGVRWREKLAVRKYFFRGNRDQIRICAANYSLVQLIKLGMEN